VLDQPPAGLHQPLLQTGQRPVLNPSRQNQTPPQISQVVGQQAYSADEVADFYRTHWQLIDNAWLPAVLKMKEDWLAMANDPDKFLRDRRTTAGEAFRDCFNISARQTHC
jgi:hypothetical protein